MINSIIDIMLKAIALAGCWVAISTWLDYVLYNKSKWFEKKINPSGKPVTHRQLIVELLKANSFETGTFLAGFLVAYSLAYIGVI